jgi:hypothetical protein
MVSGNSLTVGLKFNLGRSSYTLLDLGEMPLYPCCTKVSPHKKHLLVTTFVVQQVGTSVDSFKFQLYATAAVIVLPKLFPFTDARCGDSRLF